MRNLKETIVNCERMIKAIGSEVDFVEDHIIGVDCGTWLIIISEEMPDQIGVSFHVNTCPMMVASITKRLIQLAELAKIDIRFSEFYAFEFNDEGDLVDVTFGEEAYDTVGREPFSGI